MAMYGVVAPLAYAAFLIGSLLIFSKVYRKRQAKRAHREPWFGPHHARDIYVSLLSMDPPPPRNVLVSALIRRAITDIQRVMEIRENKAALQNLLTKGQIGDDTWNHLLETEKEMDSELYEVVQEANHFRPGWGQYIFPHAGDMIQHEKNKKLFDGIEEERKRLAEKYASNTSPGLSDPILGLVGGKRSLPSTTPSNAQLPGSNPPSKPGTPAPSAGPGQSAAAKQATQAQLQAAMQQRTALQQAQQQHALNMQRQQQQEQQQQRNSALSPQSTPSKSASQSKNGSPTNGTTTPGGSVNGKNSKAGTSASSTPAKSSANGSRTSSPNPTMMLRQPSTTSTINDSDADDDDEDGGDEVASSVGSPPNAAGTKKTPKKKNKKKGKKK